MTYENILVEQRGAVTLVTLNRPKALNALNSAVLAELIAAFSAYDADETQRCAVLTGSERAFAAGADIKEMEDQGFRQHVCVQLLPGLGEGRPPTRKPWIAAVAGYALGGGCESAMMADFIIAADNAPVRPARDQARSHARHGRLAAPDPRRRQGQGDGDVPHRPDDGRRGSRARRAGRRVVPRTGCSTRR
jgi:1,4-dihydroxy-2-naphthoyl-CoA synthase